MIDENLKNRIEKIKALAERGVGGEKITAQNKLEKLLRDNGLTLESLESEQKQYYLFSYSDSHANRLLNQIIYKVLGPEEGTTFYRSRGKRMKVGVYCTPSQKIEIELDYEFYRNLFETEVDQLLSAFIQQQDLFPPGAPTTEVDLGSMSPEEIKQLLKQQAYQKNMDKQTRKTMIEKKD